MNHQVAEGTQEERGHASVVPFALYRHASPRLRDRPSGADPVGACIVNFWGICPWTEQFSDYDRRNVDLYARLLHDESEGASEDDLALGVFALDPYRNRSRVLAILRSHLRRAHWIADTLFPMLDW